MGPDVKVAAGARAGLRTQVWVPAVPLLTGAAGLAACTVIALLEPTDGRYGACPFLALTGRWCPACGGLRGTNRLLNGDVAAALSFNPLLLAALPWALWAWLAWALPRLGGPRLRAPTVSQRTGWAILGGVLIFWVLRNLPWGPLPLLAP